MRIEASEEEFARSGLTVGKAYWLNSSDFPQKHGAKCPGHILRDNARTVSLPASHYVRPRRPDGNLGKKRVQRGSKITMLGAQAEWLWLHALRRDKVELARRRKAASAFQRDQHYRRRGRPDAIFDRIASFKVEIEFGLCQRQFVPLQRARCKTPSRFRFLFFVEQFYGARFRGSGADGVSMWRKTPRRFPRSYPGSTKRAG